MRRTKAGEIAKVVLDNIAGIFDLNLGRGRNEAEERSATLPHGNLGPFRDDHDRGLRHNPTELHRTELCNAASQQPQPRSKMELSTESEMRNRVMRWIRRSARCPPLDESDERPVRADATPVACARHAKPPRPTTRAGGRAGRPYCALLRTFSAAPSRASVRSSSSRSGSWAPACAHVALQQRGSSPLPAPL